MSNTKDKLYSTAHQSLNPFRFDERVASVFSDMISRSVPSYQPILAMLPTITRQFRFDGLNYYDLGCSLGAGLHAMAEGLKPANDLKPISATLIGIDNSAAMLSKARQQPPSHENLSVEFREQNILQCEFDDSAMVLMNFTLQFVPIESRDDTIQRIFNGLCSGGALVLSEKIKFADPRTSQVMTDIHHQYKADQGYSQLEISQKRDAIENVLIPETLDVHTRRLQQAGFKVITPWLQNLQFLSILAVK